MTTYRVDMRRAWDRVNSVRAQRLETRLGTIEYANQGEGTPLLVSHGVLGSHVESFDGWWSKLPGPGFRVIAPSRFGYFGSTLPDAASPADQADADALLPTAYSQMMGIPKGYRPGSPEEAEAIAASRELLFPFRPRRDGAVFDGYVSNMVADRFPLEELTVPTLVINARDGPLAPYRVRRQGCIPDPRSQARHDRGRRTPLHGARHRGPRGDRRLRRRADLSSFARRSRLRRPMRSPATRTASGPADPGPGDACAGGARRHLVREGVKTLDLAGGASLRSPSRVRMLDRDLYETRALARIPAMRNTIFIVPKALVATMFAAKRRTSLHGQPLVLQMYYEIHGIGRTRAIRGVAFSNSSRLSRSAK